MPGIADEGTGAARAAADQARFALAEAEERLAARRGEYDNAPERGVMSRSYDGWEWASGQATAGRRMAGRAARELQKSPGFFHTGGVRAGFDEVGLNNDREADVATGQGWAERHQAEANAAATQYNQAQQDLEKKRGSVADAEKEAAKARYDYETKILDIRRNQLSIVEKEVEKGRAGAVASGMAAPGDTAQIRAAVEQGQKYGWGTLTQRQKGMVASDPDAADWARQQSEAAGRNDPDRQGIRRALGKQELWVEEETANARRDAIAGDEADANARYKKTIGDSAMAMRDELVTAIADAITLSLQNIRQDVLNAVEKKQQDRVVGAQQAGGG
jgi:hypothetical protein